MMGYYDIVLGLIPLALGGITAVLTALGVGLTTAVPLASAVALFLILHAMFVRTPVSGASSATRAPASSHAARVPEQLRAD
ncbi:hypothetical protein [Natronomonas sp. EA1]|uniref:hypothetical protein n=1 Tax=Natronomonas sp. EA1 TaxID=3421655 RepID=UPI003EB6D365